MYFIFSNRNQGSREGDFSPPAPPPLIFHKFQSFPMPSKCFYVSVKRHLGGSQAINIQLAFSTTVFSLQIKNYAVSIVT